MDGSIPKIGTPTDEFWAKKYKDLRILSKDTCINCSECPIDTIESLSPEDLIIDVGPDVYWCSYCGTIQFYMYKKDNTYRVTWSKVGKPQLSYEEDIKLC